MVHQVICFLLKRLYLVSWHAKSDLLHLCGVPLAITSLTSAHRSLVTMRSSLVVNISPMLQDTSSLANVVIKIAN